MVLYCGYNFQANQTTHPSVINTESSDLGKSLGCKRAIFENICNYHRKLVST